MEIVTVTRKDGTEEEIKVYNSLDFPYEDINPIAKTARKGKDGMIGYCLEFGAFDIETTSLKGKRKLDDQGEPAGWITPPKAFMYTWQACVAGVCVMGRYWFQFFKFIEKLCTALRLGDRSNGSVKRFVFYVHNLGFELSFLYPFFDEYFGGAEIFASNSHHPITIRCGNGIEFRCSYKLTNMNLYMFTQTELHCRYVKAYDDLDYSIIRTPETELTKTEIGYCILDVLGLWDAVNSKMKTDGDDVTTIPLTATGYPRRICRRACREFPNYREKYFKKLKLSYFVYKLLKEAKRGGDTHASRWMAGRILLMLLGADYVSDYPAQILLRDFPMGPFHHYGACESEDELLDLMETYCCLFRVRIFKPRLREGVAMPYIATDKIWERTGTLVCDNGRLLRDNTGMIAMTVTELDWKIIREQYDMDYFAISDLYVSDKGPLPEPIRETVKTFFGRKCRLKRELNEAKKALEKDKKNPALIDKVNELKYLYDRSKNHLNSIFGMMMTSPCQMETVMDEQGNWKENVLEDGMTEEKLLEKFYKARNSFLQFSWGIWVTAWGRYALHELRRCAISETGEECAAYGDTDSVKSQVWDMEKVKELNDKIIALNEEREAYYEHEDGTKEYIGVAEFDSKYDRFITLGAKKYAYEDKDGLHVTVSGVAAYPKPGHKLGPGAEELQAKGGLEAFRTGFKFKDAGGIEIIYAHADPHYVKVKGCVFETASYAAMAPSVYTLGITEEYKNLIGYV